MKPVPRNNYPREGEHNIVTGEGVRGLEQQRPTSNSTLDYTIGGSTQAEVRTTVEAARQYAINRGHRILQQAMTRFNSNHQRASHKSLTPHFNIAKDTPQNTDTIKERALRRREQQRQRQSHSQEQEETP